MFNIPLTQAQIQAALVAFFSIGAPGTLLGLVGAVIGGTFVFSALRAVLRRA
ncbi:MAG: hypothetical protein HY868_16675 [Chloroflexi bacterium]|nr:hypothetical protein [Chloroflexota bacterium]